MQTNDKNGGINIFLIGNNPSEISSLRNHLENYPKIRFFTRFAFDLRKSFSDILNYKPQYILLDDGYPGESIKNFIKKLRNNFDTRETPVAILKSGNYPLNINDIQDFHLKSNFSPERIFASIRSFRNLRKTQTLLRLTYRKMCQVKINLFKFSGT